MAEEITVNQVESEIIELEDVDEKENPIEFEGLIITKGPPKILSRYRRDRRSSCHDLCKYGIPHATEEKPWKTAKKRRERKTNVSGEILTSLEGTKKSGRSSDHSLTSKVGEPEYTVDIKEVITSEKTATSEKNSPPFEETDVSMEHDNSDIVQPSSETSSHHVKQRSKSQTKWELVKNKCAFGSSSIKETAIRSKQKGTFSSGGKDKSSASNFLSSTKQNVKKPSSSSDTSKNLRRVSSQKNHENGEELKPELANNDNLPDKILHVIEPNSENLSDEPTLACDATKSLSPLPSASHSSSGDKSLKRTTNKTGNSGVSASSRKGLRHVGQGTVSGTLSHQSSGNKFKTNIQHKTRSASRSSPSQLSTVSSSNSSSLRKQNGTTYKPNKTGHSNQGENVKVGYKIRPKMTTIVGAANNVIPTRKLTFRRGKVIEIQPQSNNIPRRLKFRSARLLGDDIRRDVNGTRKRTVADKEVDGGELHSANIKTEKVDLKQQTVERSKNGNFGRRIGGVDRSRIYGSKSGSDKVVLRHQNVEWKKKQNSGLYNNVIEETASKLTELRKSKVKALVGAFETVISLDSPREGAAHAEVSTVC
ncbi:hypothetical protein L195_g011433 [Trifolium pratense]|uniref:Calmodulin-binding domain-containing protein n=1 Tax=Trifolium pratense TaxID=57577 RepID=A0A2K3PHI9_TRIPR|nr:hypothetical protein L195_g011433 [Trifolium pratense]